MHTFREIKLVSVKAIKIDKVATFTCLLRLINLINIFIKDCLRN